MNFGRAKARLRSHSWIGDRAFYATVISIVLPIIIQNTITQVVGLLDNVMVGRIGTLPMSAVAISNQLLFVFNLCIFGGLSGAGIFAAQFAGAGDEEGVRYCFRMKLYIALGALLVACFAFVCFPEQLLSLYIAEGTGEMEMRTTLEYGLTYLRILVLGLFPFALTQVYGSTLRESGETRLPMLASITAILVNLVFNYLLIFGKFGFPKLGVAGAAIATVLSRFVELAIIVFYTHLRKKQFGFIRGVYRSARIPLDLLVSIAKKGSPLLINEFLWSSGIAVLVQCYSVRGLEVIAAVNISSTISNLFNVVFMSMGNAVAIMVGQALGAGKKEEAAETVWKIIALALASCAVMGSLLLVTSPVIPLLYNTEDTVRSMAMKLLCVQAVVMPMRAFCHCCYFTLRAGGKTMITFFFDCAFTWCVSVAMAYLLAHFTKISIVPMYFIVEAMEFVKCIVGYILVKKGIWIQNIVSKGENA